jgi:cytochrome c-type biogenesis protein
MTGALGVLTAFAAGLLSFLSPCVLPLIPGYLSFLTGMTAAELAEEERPTARVLGPALLFVAGFTLIFVALGASASVIGGYLVAYRVLVERIAGLIVVAFGILLLGVIPVPWLYGEARADLSRSRAFGRGAAFVMGMAFAAGWTPCVGPILGAILAMAASAADLTRGALLLLAYSLGLGVPFIGVALLLGRVSRLMRWLKRHSVTINRVAGAILIAVGALIASGRLGVLAGWLGRLVPSLGI